jgi:hypothetical protein
VSFSRLFIANPDLVSRLALGHELAAGDRGTHYAGGARGYVDYPIWSGPVPAGRPPATTESRRTWPPGESPAP